MLVGSHPVRAWSPGKASLISVGISEDETFKILVLDFVPTRTKTLPSSHLLEKNNANIATSLSTVTMQFDSKPDVKANFMQRNIFGICVLLIGR